MKFHDFIAVCKKSSDSIEFTVETNDEELKFPNTDHAK